MGVRANIALRPWSEAEQHSFQRVAKALQAVAVGQTLTQTGQASDLSREGISQLVERFNQRALTVLMIAWGRGASPDGAGGVSPTQA